MECKNVCQSCGMPMGDSQELLATNADGSKNEEYCKYCMENGKFLSDVTMEGMIETCVPYMVEQGMEETAARGILKEALPKLKRWRS